MSSERVFAVDVGNTRMKFAVLVDGRVERFTAIRFADAVPWEQFDAWKAELGLDGAIVAGPNPPAVDRLLDAWPSGWTRPRVIRETRSVPIVADVDFPERVGVDRLLNAVAANRLRRPDQSAIVVASGTAITVDWVRSDGRFAGGAILPGLELSAQALHDYTALLPLIPKADLRDPSPPVLGRNTRDAIRSGLLWGHVGAVKELTSRLLAICPSGTPPLVVLTGGAGPLLTEHLPHARFEPALGLLGLVETWRTMQTIAAP